MGYRNGNGNGSVMGYIEMEMEMAKTLLPPWIRDKLSTPRRKSRQHSEHYFQKKVTDHSDDEDDAVDDHGDGGDDDEDGHDKVDGYLTVTSLQGDRLESLEKVRLHFLNSFWGGKHYRTLLSYRRYSWEAEIIDSHILAGKDILFGEEDDILPCSSF